MAIHRSWKEILEATGDAPKQTGLFEAPVATVLMLCTDSESARLASQEPSSCGHVCLGDLYALRGLLDSRLKFSDSYVGLGR